MGLYSAVFPATLHEFKVMVSDDIAVLFQLDAFQRWFVHVFFVLGGKGVRLFVAMVGKADDVWLAKFYEDYEDF